MRAPLPRDGEKVVLMRCFSEACVRVRGGDEAKHTIAEHLPQMRIEPGTPSRARSSEE